MGKYFVMSRRFDKRSASDFGLVQKNENVAISLSDDSTWIKAELYDFGWGSEYGFCKLPLPSFSTLFELVLHSDDLDDMYGAASVILSKYPDMLLEKCEKIFNHRAKKEETERLVSIFNLEIPINRSPTDHKTIQQINEDFARWEALSELAKK